MKALRNSRTQSYGVADLLYSRYLFDGPAVKNYNALSISSAHGD
jgi:hypothetical protein